MSKQSHLRRSRAAFAFGGIIFVALAALLACMIFFHESATPSPSPNATHSEITVSDDGFPVVDWEYWKSVNPDIVGWVTVPGTSIDQPIVQAQANDPQYYLDHDIYRNYNVYGCPYLDAACAETGLFDSRNAVIFGHHMVDGAMLSPFASFSDAAFAQEHARILVQSPDAKLVFLAQAAEIAPGWEALKRTEFNNAVDFRSYVADRYDASVVKLSDDILTTSNMITFCTCSYNYWVSNERTLVYAISEVTP